MKKVTLAFVLSVLVIGSLFADKAVPGLYLDQSVQTSNVPLGVQLVSQFLYRVPLARSTGILWESTKIDFGVINTLSPAYELAGVFVDVEPIAFFDLALTAQFTGYFSALGFGLVDLPGYAAGFDKASVSELTQSGAAGYMLGAAPTLKVAFGPFAALETFSVTYFHVGDGSGYFFEWIANCALGKSDYELSNQLYGLVTIFPGLLAGFNDYLLIVPGSAYISHRVAGVGVLAKGLTERLSLYSALMLGTFLADRYSQYTLFVGGQVGLTAAF